MTSPPAQSSSSSSSLTTRFRSGSSTTSLLLSPSPNASRSSTPQPRQSSYKPKYHNRSRSSVPSSNSSVKPRVLPFPDLPVRPISRDGSRAGSPTRGMYSPGWTPRGSSANLSEEAGRALSPRGSTSGGVPMMVGGSMEGAGSDLGEGSSTALRRESRTRFDLGSGSTSPTSTSPLASSLTPLGLSTSSTLRPRALTSPAPVDIPRTPRDPSTSDQPSISMSASASSSSALYTHSDPTSSTHLSAPNLTPLPPSPAFRQSQSPSVPPVTPGEDLPRPPKIQFEATGKLSAIQLSPSQPTQPLQDHLYRSFLSGECADVRLWVKKWGVAWHVHKMVLVQAGFFHSLFLGGFSEMTSLSAKLSPASRKGKGKAGLEGDDEWTGDDVELRFDDPNITRAAFEISLSRLYSPYPHLHFPLSLLPTASHPLTPSYPSLQPIPIASDPPDMAHLATPNLLLSLLATTVYLGHTPLMREVLGIVMRTIGVGTIGKYLGFALGAGISDEEGVGENVRGLEGVGREMKGSRVEEEEEDEVEQSISDLSHGFEPVSQDDTTYKSSHRDSTASTGSKTDDEVKVGSVPSTSYVPTPTMSSSITAGSVTRTVSNASTIRPTAGSGRMGMTTHPHPYDPTNTSTPNLLERNDEGKTSINKTNHSAEDDVSSHSLDPGTMPHFYGSVSNKIGEACACWLARWGMDILAAEIAISDDVPTGPSGGDHEEEGQDGYRIFRHKGLPAQFLRGLLSSDTLWVTGGEMGRYRAVRDILDLRRRGWEAELGLSTGREEEGKEGASESGDEEDERWDEWEEDEVELGRVLAEGVYYQHMSFDDLSIIANDIDPNTSLPYAPLPVLQAAHWAAADLKSRILASDPTSSSSVADSPELGLVVTAADLMESTNKGRRKVTPRSRVVSPTNSESRLNVGRKGGEERSGLYPSIRRVPSTAFSPAGQQGKDTVYYPIPSDDTHRAGAGGLTFMPTAHHAGVEDRNMSGSTAGSGAEGGLHAGEGGWWSDDDNPSGTGKKRTPPASEKTFFGLLNSCLPLSDILSSNSPSSFPHSTSTASSPSTRYTPTQPFRFSVEFHNLHTLPEKERLYSTTHFHAGSWWNVYVQTIRKKDKSTTQLGVYLHRQNKKDGVPRASRPRSPTRTAPGRAGEEVIEARGTRVERNRRDRRSEGDSAAEAGGEPQGLSTSMSRLGLAGSGSGQGRTSVPVTASASTSAFGPSLTNRGYEEEDMFGEETYLDGRRVTRAYFSITCASALGTALIRFSSSPDTFTLSQSWGWKSSALRSEEYLGVSSALNLQESTGQSRRGEAVEGVEGERLEDGVLGWVGDWPQGDSAYGAGRGSLRATVVVGVI